MPPDQMEDLPEELQKAIRELERDYDSFQYHPGGCNGYLVFARNRISKAEVAIKFYYGAPGDRRHDEPRLLASIKSPNVLPIIDARNLSDGWAFFLTKRCGDGDLDQFISEQPSAHRAIDVALGICTGVSAIHASGLIHRDLKPANIVSDGGTPLIADFGSVRKLAEGETDLPASGHSTLYRPPESFETGRYSLVGDIYQIGLVAYQLLGGCLPYDPLKYFNSKDKKEYAEITDDFDQSKFQDGIIHQRAAAGRLINMESLPPWVRRGARNSLRLMTHPDPSRRLKTTGDVAAALTRIRVDTLPWKWVNDVARLERQDRIIELRPIGEDLYEPFQAKGDTFRHVPSASNASLADLVARF